MPKTAIQHCGGARRWPHRMPSNLALHRCRWIFPTSPPGEGKQTRRFLVRPLGQAPAGSTSSPCSVPQEIPIPQKVAETCALWPCPDGKLRGSWRAAQGAPPLSVGVETVITNPWAVSKKGPRKALGSRWQRSEGPWKRVENRSASAWKPFGLSREALWASFDGLGRSWYARARGKAAGSPWALLAGPGKSSKVWEGP